MLKIEIELYCPRSAGSCDGGGVDPKHPMTRARSGRHRALRGAATVALAVSLLGRQAAGATGDNLASFDATATAGIPACGTGIGTGIAYDGTNLILSCWGSNTLERVNATTHLNAGPVTISGASDLGALAWDQARNRLWACESDGTVILIDVAGAVVDNVTQPSFGTGGCVDGLAYDGSDDSLWVSADVASSTCHYKLNPPAAPTLLGCPSNSGLIGSCGNSGIAVGGPNLYLANNGCSQIYTVDKTFSSSTLFASFPARLEDLECDGRTFSPMNKGAIWSIDAYDRTVNAWEIAPGLCAFGGLGHCGDGSLDPGEQCDDGNTTNGDGCDADCQTEGCGNGLLDQGEECDLSSPSGALVCPPGSVCTPQCHCMSPETTTTTTTTTTTSTTTTTTLPVLDHFQCYEIKPKSFPTISGVSVQDQFGQHTASVRFPHRLCAPADKRDEFPDAPTHPQHLIGHVVSGSSVKVPNQTLVNQFGTIKVDVVRPDILMVPTLKSLAPPGPPPLVGPTVDHFQCYKVKRSKGAPKFQKILGVKVDDQFGTALLDLLKPVRLCAPANKRNEDPTAPNHPGHLLCYKTKNTAFGTLQTFTNSQFGPAQPLLIHRRELCVPTLKNPGSTTTTTLASTTTTSTTTSTTTTLATTTTTTSTTTTTTVYSSPSGAFLAPAADLLD